MSDPTTDPKVVRWAILGTGCIANDMVQVLKQLPHTQVVAIGSRAIESATAFGNKWDIPRKYGSYEDAVADADVDVCYVATPSLRHPDDCMLALKRGKSVLCEKSMAPNHVVAGEVLDMSITTRSLFVHGVWSRFFPAMKKIRDIIDSGEIGIVRSARASFCQNDGAGSCSALLETGIYCAQFLQWALTDGGRDDDDIIDIDEDGPSAGPVVRGACMTLHEGSGKDEHVTAIIEFPGRRMGMFECSLAHCSTRSASIHGSEGVIDVPFPFWCVLSCIYDDGCGRSPNLIVASRSFSCMLLLFPSSYVYRRLFYPRKRCPTTITVTKMTGLGSQRWSKPVTYDFPLPSDVIALSTRDGDVPGFNFVNSTGLAYEAMEVNRCHREGLLESPLFSTKQCIEILRLISDIGEFAAK